MANIADLKLIEIGEFEQTSAVAGTGEEFIVVRKADGKTYKMATADFKAFLGTVQVQVPRAISPTDPAPTLPGIYRPTVSGTYANLGGMVIDTNGKLNEVIYDGTTLVNVVTPMPETDTSGLVAKSSIVTKNTSRNQFNKADYRVDRSLKEDGTLGVSPGYKTTQRLAIPSGETHIALSGMRAGNYSNRINFFDASGSIFSRTFTTETLIQEIPVGATEYQIQFHNANYNDPTIDDRFMINFGRSVLPYEPYQVSIVEIDGKKIAPDNSDTGAQEWKAQSYFANIKVTYNDAEYRSIDATTASDVPGISDKWKYETTGDDAPRVFEITKRFTNSRYDTNLHRYRVNDYLATDKFHLSAGERVIWEGFGENAWLAYKSATSSEIKSILAAGSWLAETDCVVALGMRRNISVFKVMVEWRVRRTSYLNPRNAKDLVTGKAVADYVDGVDLPFALVGSIYGTNGAPSNSSGNKSTYMTEVNPDLVISIKGATPSSSVKVRRFSDSLLYIDELNVTGDQELQFTSNIGAVAIHTAAVNFPLVKIKGHGGGSGETNQYITNIVNNNNVTQNLISTEDRLLGIADTSKVPSDFTGYDASKANIWKVGSPMTANANWGNFTISEADLLTNDITIVRNSDGTWGQLIKSTVPSPRKDTNLLVDIRDFGSNGNDNDDQAAFDNIIAQVIAEKNGVVYLPAGVYNGAFTIPGRNRADRGVIEIRGEMQPKLWFGTVPGPAGSDPYYPLSGATIIRSNDTARGAVVSCGKGQDLYFSFSAVLVKLKNLDIRTYENPNMHGVDMAYASQLIMEDCHVNTGINNTHSEEPVYDKTGIITPLTYNSAIVDLTNVAATGYRTGMTMTEHFSGHNIRIHGCVTALRINHTGHASHITRLLVQACRRILEIDKKSLFTIQQLVVEKNFEEENPWYGPDIFDIYVNDEQARGLIESVAVGGQPVILNKNGGANVKQRANGSVNYV